MNDRVAPEPELVQGPVALCGPDGRLNRDAVGWSRHPLHDCTLHRRWPRKKRWNYWCVTSDRYLFSVTLSTLDYAGVIFIYVLDFESKQFIERTWTVPFGIGIRMSDAVEGTCIYDTGDLRACFRQSNERVSIEVTCGRFVNGPLDAELTIEIPPGHESLNVVIPWSDRHYQFTSKQHALPAAGTVRFDDTDIQFTPETAFACLDFGRGVWPYRCTWNWGGGSGMCGGRVVGLNFGGQWTDGTGMTENGVVVDGVLQKVSDDVVFEYDNRAFMDPWTVHSRRSDEVNLTFTPFYERVAKSNLLLIQSEVHQMIGTYAGTVTAPSGEPLQIDGVIGWAEEHVAKW